MKVGDYMPFPNVDPLIETFLEPTRIFLFGKPFPTLEYKSDPMSRGGTTGTGGTSFDPEFEPYAEPSAAGGTSPAPELPMPPGQVEQALRQAADGGIFARIYGFSFEGHYYKLPRPSLFLVRGEGRKGSLDEAGPGGRGFSTRLVGVEAKDWHFGSDIRVWAVDRYDIAVCLDVEIGSYDEVLLQWLTDGDDDGAFRGAAAGRGAAASRGAASFRGAALGPHQDR